MTQRVLGSEVCVNGRETNIDVICDETEVTAEWYRRYLVPVYVHIHTKVPVHDTYMYIYIHDVHTCMYWNKIMYILHTCPLAFEQFSSTTYGRIETNIPVVLCSINSYV